MHTVYSRKNSKILLFVVFLLLEVIKCGNLYSAVRFQKFYVECERADAREYNKFHEVAILLY